MTIKEIRTWYETETGDVPEGTNYTMWLEVIASQQGNRAERLSARVDDLEKEMDAIFG